MKILWKFCIRSLKENKARTIVTILGVALATALITAMACLGTSLLTSEIEHVKNTMGNSHGIFGGVAYDDLKYFLNNQSLEAVRLKKRLGYAEMKKETQFGGKFYVELCAAGTDWFKDAEKLRLSSGRFPENEKEIVLARGIRSDMGVDVKIGDSLTLSLGKRVADGREVEIGEMPQEGETLEITETRSFVIVGFLDAEGDSLYGTRSGPNRSRNGSMSLIRAYTFFDARMLSNGLYDVSVRYTKNGLYEKAKVDSALLGVTEEYYNSVYRPLHTPTEEERIQLSRRVKAYSPYSTLVSLEGLSPFHLTKDSAAWIALIELFFLIFVFAGVFCIDNSFDISLQERIRQYGILSSVGTTRRQRRLLVWLEAMVIGTFGIPLGVLTGLAFSYALVTGTNVYLGKFALNYEFVMVFDVAWWAILIAVIQAACMIAFSAMESAVRAARISPIAAIRGNEMVASKGKVSKTPWLIKKCFGIGGCVAWQNFKRAKTKYRATVISIIISVALVLGMSFIGLLFEMGKKLNADEWQYQVEVTISKEADYEKLLEIAGWPGVLSHKITRETLILETEYSDDESLKEQTRAFYVMAIDDDTFAGLCRENGLNPEKVKGKGLVTAGLADYAEGRTLTGNHRTHEDRKENLPGEPVSVELAGVAGKIESLHQNYHGLEDAIVVFVGESWAKTHKDLYVNGCTGFYTCVDAYALTEKILDLDLLDSRCYNLNGQYQETKFTQTLVTMFLVGFLAVIILIGVTNVINAVNFNLELRSSEFAKLRAVGMTRKQFRGMILLEGLFIDVKGLLWGTAIGCFVSYALYRFSWESSLKAFEFDFRIPWFQILCCILVVSGLLFWVVETYGKRAMKRNVIETIRNENL